MFRVDFLYDWLVWSPCCPRESQESFPTPQFESINSSVLSILYGATLKPVYDFWENYGFDYMDIFQQSDVSTFNTWFRFVITFLPRRKHLLISWLQSLSTMILDPKKIKSVTASNFSLSICHELIGSGDMILHLLMLSVKPAFSLLSFILIKRLFSSASFSAFRLVSPAYLMLLVFLPATLILDCESSSRAFHMMYFAYKLNNQGDNIQPWHTPFPNLTSLLFHVQF